MSNSDTTFPVLIATQSGQDQGHQITKTDIVLNQHQIPPPEASVVHFHSSNQEFELDLTDDASPSIPSAWNLKNPGFSSHASRITRLITPILPHPKPVKVHQIEKVEINPNKKKNRKNLLRKQKSQARKASKLARINEAGKKPPCQPVEFKLVLQDGKKSVYDVITKEVNPPRMQEPKSFDGGAGSGKKEPRLRTLLPVARRNTDLKLELQDDKNSKSDVVTKNANPPRMEPYNFDLGAGRYPSGVPRSFLKQQQNLGAISPQYPKGIPKSFLQHPTPNIAPVQSGSPIVQNPMKWMKQPNPPVSEQSATDPLYVQTNTPTEIPQQYSPSDAYADGAAIEDDVEGNQSDQNLKRVSAFHRLGPVSQPKKPKLTINLLCNQDVREVVDETESQAQYVPVHLREDVQKSTDDIVKKYLPIWPWKRHHSARKSVTARASKSVMLLEQEQMEEVYDRDNTFVQVVVKGYPPTWKKEQVLDVLLDNIRGKSFIPCFTEFSSQECKFLVIRCRVALNMIHKLGFCVRKDDVDLSIVISLIDLSLNHIDFIPRLVLRKKLSQGYDDERKLTLEAFTLQSDISHFIYYPLNQISNQADLVELQSTVAWDYLTDLNLSHNRITSIEGFNLPKTTPKLKNLDLSFNCIDRVTTVLQCRDLVLRSLKLEGNPLCHDYTDPAHYVKVVRMIFPELKEIDGLPIHLAGDMPRFKRNYCPEPAQNVADKVLEVFFTLLDSPIEERMKIEELYDEKAVLTVTYRRNVRTGPLHRYFRNLLLRARSFEEGEMESIVGANSITKLICKWPSLIHDPFTFTVDVIHHSEISTILRISGILKLTVDSLAEDEHLLSFTRTLVLVTKDGIEYKIKNEMVLWEQPTSECANIAFQRNRVAPKRVSLKLESPPDKELQENLTKIFMQITDLDKAASERCLQTKDWNLKSALEHFMRLLKIDGISALR